MEGTVFPVFEASDIVIQMPARHARFRGWLIREVSSRIEAETVRFTVIRLYRVQDDRKPGINYLISSVGRSVVYHAARGCALGTMTRVGDIPDELYDELSECPRCRPEDIENFGDDEYVRLETDRVNPVRECKDAASVIRRLEQQAKDEQGNLLYDDNGEPVMDLSAPAQRLLKDAALLDEGIAQELGKIEDLLSVLVARITIRV